MVSKSTFLLFGTKNVCQTSYVVEAQEGVGIVILFKSFLELVASKLFAEMIFLLRLFPKVN